MKSPAVVSRTLNTRHSPLLAHGGALLFVLSLFTGCAANRGNPGGTSPKADSAGSLTGIIGTGVRWIGRVDASTPAAVKFAWSGSGFVATVSGTHIAVRLRSEGSGDPVYFQPRIDGSPAARFSVATSDGEKSVTLASGLAPGDHLVELVRETEGKPGFATSVFLGFDAGTPKDPPAFSGRLIEIVGDSISAGYGNLGSEQHPNYGPDPSGGCHFSTETESAAAAYGAVAARTLGADVSVLGASGWGIYSDNGGNRNNVLPTIYDRTLGNQATPTWDFAVKPQAVVINLGTNDFNANMQLGSEEFTGAYAAFVATVRDKYPDALILCAIGPMLYGTGLTNARKYIRDLVSKLKQSGDQKVRVLDFGQQNISVGSGCDYHPSVSEHQRLAQVLVDELRSNLAW